MCRFHPNISYTICKHGYQAKTEFRDYWDLCDHIRSFKDAKICEAQDRNKDKVHRHGVKKIDGICVPCFDAVTEPEWEKFQEKWQDQLATMDWECIGECATVLVDGIRPVDRRRRFCCPGDYDPSHNGFECKLRKLLEKGKKRKPELDQGWTLEPLCVPEDEQKPAGFNLASTLRLPSR